jgi:hypothetical protein
MTGAQAFGLDVVLRIPMLPAAWRLTEMPIILSTSTTTMIVAAISKVESAAIAGSALRSTPGEALEPNVRHGEVNGLR